MLREDDLVPHDPELDHLALCEAKEIHLPHIDGPTGRHPRSEAARIEDTPMRTREVDVGRHDVSLGDEVVHVMPQLGEGGEPL